MKEKVLKVMMGSRALSKLKDEGERIDLILGSSKMMTLGGSREDVIKSLKKRLEDDCKVYDTLYI